MPDLPTEDIRGVEILRTGRWHGTNCPKEGCEFTIADLDQLVQTSNETSGKLDPPVKLGHDKDQKLLQEDGFPAAGWIRNLRRVGERLVADFVKVPQKIADLMKAGALAKRSVEIMRDFDVDGTKHKLALTGVALLGADLPAVDSLKDIEKLYQGMGYAPEGGGYYFEAGEDDQKVADDATPKEKVAGIKTRLRALRAEAESLIKGRKGTPVLRALFRDVEETLDRIAAGRSKFSKGDDMAFPEALLKLLGLDADADEDTIATAITDLKSAKGEDGGGESAAVKSLKADLESTRETVVELQGSQAKQEAESLVDTAISEGRVFPAQRDTLIKMAVSNPDQTKELVDGMKKVVDTSERGSDANLEGAALLASVEPTPDQIKIMVDLKNDSPEQRVELMRLNAVRDGVKLPDGWESTYLPEKKD